MNVRGRRWSVFGLAMCVALALAGCGDDDGVAPGTDAGAPVADAGGGDAGPGADAGGGDAGPGGLDGGAGADAGSLDAGPCGPDGGRPSVLCESFPGCTWVGLTCSSCGTLVCDDGGRPMVCGGFGGGTCPATQFCDYALADICGAADATGVCSRIPDTCPVTPDPVCGCDGRTFTNTCIAHMAGVAVASMGACP